MSTLIHLLSLSGGILAVLALLLLATLTVLIERGWFYFHVLRPAGGRSTSRAPSGTPARNGLEAFARHPDTPNGQVAATALEYLDEDPRSLEMALEHRITEILPSLDRNLWMLDTTVTLAPLFGLLGTIIGMVQTFNLLGKGPGLLTGHATGGIADALVATGSGLFVAIIAVIGLSIFNSQMREAVRQLDAIKLGALAIARNRDRDHGTETPKPGENTLARVARAVGDARQGEA